MPCLVPCLDVVKSVQFFYDSDVFSVIAKVIAELYEDALILRIGFGGFLVLVFPRFWVFWDFVVFCVLGVLGFSSFRVLGFFGFRISWFLGFGVLGLLSIDLNTSNSLP